MSEKNDEESNIPWKETSDRADAINSILSVLNCPSQARVLIHVLLGISNGRVEFEASHKEIATRMKKQGDKLLDENAEQVVKRAHRSLRDWQKEHSLNLIEYVPGTNYNNIRKESRYYLHILSVADNVLAQVTKGGLASENRSNVLISSALLLRKSYAPNFVFSQHKYKRPRDKEVIKNIRSGITYFRKAIKELEKEDGFIFLEDSLIDELEQTLNKLKQNTMGAYLLRKHAAKEGDKSDL